VYILLVFLMYDLTCMQFFDMYMSWRSLFRVTLKISRTSCNIDVTPGTLTATDTCIGYYVTRFEASRKVILHTRYVSTCVGAGCERDRGTKIQTQAIRCRTCYFWTYYMYNSSLRHTWSGPFIIKDERYMFTFFIYVCMSPYKILIGHLLVLTIKFTR
jgi:hypothetical protein